MTCFVRVLHKGGDYRIPAGAGLSDNDAFSNGYLRHKPVSVPLVVLYLQYVNRSKMVTLHLPRIARKIPPFSMHSKA